MRKLSAKELREAWIKFFEKNNHLYVESKSLIPDHDPSLLWINSGVATLKKYFSGQLNPPAPRLVNLQKAVRTNDIENVGKTARHHTFFEMMGNFSIGDYFKEDAIKFAYDFLINNLEIPKEKLYITVYKDDELAYKTWKECGMPENHIFKEGRDRNFWDVGNGPCGPCTEIYYDRGEKYDFDHLGIKLLEDDIENDRYVEIWNIVFSEFNNNGKNEYSELKRKNIDTGAGYERVLSVLQDVPTNFDTDLFLPIINEIEKFSDLHYDMNAFFTKDPNQLEINRCFKVIADHIKSSVFMIADGALPSNKDRGYILRRLIRRAIAVGEKLNLRSGWMHATVAKIIDIMGEFYPYLHALSDKIQLIIATEEHQFTKTLKVGLQLFNEALTNNNINAQTVFNLVQTYGFPRVLVDEMCAENNVQYSSEEYDKLFKNHQEISKGQDASLIKALMQQNKYLLELKVPSEFDYELSEIKDAKIVALMDDDFNPVDQIAGSGWVVLDRTCMYATGGGQLHDDGWINEYEIDNVVSGPNLQHIHHVESAYLKLGDIVDVRHDVFTRNLLRANHSSVHIIQAMLIRNIDKGIRQAGAFKSKEKFSFDFRYDKRLTNEQVKLVEEKANEVVRAGIPVEVLHTSEEKAREMGAIMEFGYMYAKQKVLRLIRMGNVSLELCGGTHVHNTANIEMIKITSYSSLGSGTWRIEGYAKCYNDELHVKNELKQLIEQYHDEFAKWTNHPINYEANLNIHEQIDLIASSLNAYTTAKEKQAKQQVLSDISNQIKNKQKVVIVNNLEPKAIMQALRANTNSIETLVLIINKLPTGYGYFVQANKKYLQEHQLDLSPILDKISKAVKGNFGGKGTYYQGGASIDFNEKDWTELLNL